MKKSPSRRHARWRERYGPWAVVTGASDGIGRELARALAAAGLDLVLVARRRPRLEELAAELGQRHDVATRVLAADLGPVEGARTVMAETEDLDVGLLVASAGFGSSGNLVESRLEDELAMVDVNCRALLALSHGFGRRLARRGRGGIVLLSSILAFQGVPRAANYAATKAYVQSLAEGLHAELAPLGVDVLASAPGPTHSGFADRASMRLGLAQSSSSVARATLGALGRRTTVRPGWLSKLLGYPLAALPRWGRSRIVGRVMKGMTAP